MKIEGIDVEKSLYDFIQEQSDALQNNISEQAISHQLATKLTPYFPGWTIDCKYDREGNDIKKLMYAISPKGHIFQREVVPDVIIHRRITTENLLAIEVKNPPIEKQASKIIQN
ncbi:hypothetical protein MO867_11705 [Microbulbifer sp. OS29]|uniref:Uncharacterized protein n=1 Tax=Microbulbifer okhotskensis TaxID=2926617 RepID=A0A9X2EPL5_9GAMM|nr:hypothetical protein [Microbulbifer okhotskensis]MCO1335000.1 hypothetical protein [Microbulbifer okhotskensis]